MERKIEEQTAQPSVEGAKTVKSTENFTNPTVVTKKKKGSMPLKLLCYTAIFVAFGAIANIYSFPVSVGGSINLSLVYIPTFFAGALLGPLPGFLTGLLGDLLGCWIAPKGDINFIILFASSLMGLIPGVVFLLFRKSKIKGIDYIAAIISLVLMLLICTTLNTFGLYVYYFSKKGKTFLATMVLRLSQLPIWAINSAIIILLLYPVKKIIKGNNQ